MNKQTIEKTKKIRERSPNYPAINLEVAIEKSRIIKEKEGGGKHYSPLRAILQHWGYGIKSGFALRILSALQKYGLIDITGSGNNRQIRLTELAQKILFYDSDTSTYRDAIAEAALSPAIYKELWEKYDHTVPSDSTLTSYLVFERKPSYKETVAPDLIEQFRATISFTNLEKSDILSGHEEDKVKKSENEKMDIMPKNQGLCQLPAIQVSGNASQSFNIPIIFPSGKTGAMQIPYPLTEQEWDQLLAFLKVYKPSLVNISCPERKDDKKKTTTEH